MFDLRYLEKVNTLCYDPAKCSGCGMCPAVCPHGVFKMEDRRAILADREACMECGACMRNCPTGAITVKAGVGCAAGVIYGWLRGTGPDCGCGDDGNGACC